MPTDTSEQNNTGPLGGPVTQVREYLQETHSRTCMLSTRLFSRRISPLLEATCFVSEQVSSPIIARTSALVLGRRPTNFCFWLSSRKNVVPKLGVNSKNN